MTGKLIKYEFKSSFKLMGIVWAALIVSSLLFSLCTNVFQSAVDYPTGHSTASNIISDVATAVTGFLYVMLMVAMVVITIILVIMRFYKGLFGNEGYMMNTLPVKPWQLITSKGTAAAALVLASLIVSILSIIILSGLSGIAGIPEILHIIAGLIGEEPMLLLLGIEAIILVIAGLLKSIYQIYASLAIGQLVNKYRLLLALAAYTGINMVLGFITAIFGIILESLDTSGWLEDVLINLESSNGLESIMGLSQGFMAVMFGLTIIQLVVFHVVTERIMSLKLNLQ